MEPLQVLVVDDEQDFATAIVERLNRRGMKARAVFSGREALERVQTEKYDAVVLDLKMPGMDGLEVLRLIRQIDPDVQVLVLTGHGTVSAGIDGMQLGAADFLQKPVAIGALCGSIEAAADRSRISRGSEREEDKQQRGDKR